MRTAEIKTFISAGRAVFTLQSARTGTHFTFRVALGQPQGSRPPKLFASVLIAPEVWGYLGVVSGGALVSTTGSKIAATAPSFRALQWFLRQLERGELPASLVFRHEGRCGRCGRCLTTPASIDTGLGPDCAEALGVPHEARPDTVSADIAAYRERERLQSITCGCCNGKLDPDGVCPDCIRPRPRGGPALAQVLAERRAAYAGETDGKGGFADEDSYPEP